MSNQTFLSGSENDIDTDHITEAHKEHIQREWSYGHLRYIIGRYERGEAGRKPNGVRHQWLIAEITRRRLGVET